MFLSAKDFPLDAGFDDNQFENIFLHNRYPDAKPPKKTSEKTAVSIGDKAEIWALYDGKVTYNGIDMLRQLRSLWGIHLTLKIGPRSSSNRAPRGICRLRNTKSGGETVFFEGYSGNISDATRDLITFAPYGNKEKSRALSQKFFMRLVVPLKGLSPLQRIDAVLLAYSIAAFLDKKNFAGIADPDIFTFVPPVGIRAGLSHYHRAERLLNTHLVSGFNFYEKEGEARFFTHGLTRFSMPDLLIARDGLTTADYTAALRFAHGIFLQQLMGSAKKSKLPAFKNRDTLPEQVRAMVGKDLVLAILPKDQG
jgi:hypothetical protein